MKIVIDIPKDMCKAIEQGCFGAKYNIYDLVGCVMNGTPLPKGHGRLIDADALEYFCNFEKCVPQTGIVCHHCQYHTITEYEIDTSTTIIEADKEGEQE